MKTNIDLTKEDNEKKPEPVQLEVVSIGWLPATNQIEVCVGNEDGERVTSVYNSYEDEYKEFEKCFHPEDDSVDWRKAANEFYQKNFAGRTRAV